MRQFIAPVKLHDEVSLLTAEFTAAVTDIITSSSHGLSHGSKVRLTTTTTLPAGLSLLTDYYVIEVTTDTFKLTAEKPGGTGATYTVVDITDTGTGTHTFTVAATSNAENIADFRHKEITVATSGMGAADSITVKIKGSSQETMPDFGDANSQDNLWDYVELVDQETGDVLGGNTGIVIADANDVKKLAVNVDGHRWMAAEIAAQNDLTNTVTVYLAAYND